MKYYKLNNKVFAFESDGSQNHLITEDMIKMTESEINNHLNPPIEFDTAMSNLRAKRNKLLAETDYLALSDNTMTEEVKTYRQALRDITEGLTTKEQVEAVVFPNKPQGL